MTELADMLGYSYSGLSTLAASGKLPVKTYLEGGRRWADARDVGEYLDRMREEAE